VRLISGAIEHDPDEECLLSPKQINAGYRLLCVGHARADSMIEIA
jgi:hypothetical protein